LPKVLLSVAWDDYTQVREVHRLLKLCARPTPIQALEVRRSSLSLSLSLSLSFSFVLSNHYI